MYRSGTSLTPMLFIPIFILSLGIYFLFINNFTDYVISTSETTLWVASIALALAESIFILKVLNDKNIIDLEDGSLFDKLFLLFVVTFFFGSISHVCLAFINAKIDFSTPTKIQFKVHIKNVRVTSTNRGHKTTSPHHYLMIPDPKKKDQYITKRVYDDFLAKFENGDIAECYLKSGLFGLTHYHGEIKLIKKWKQAWEEECQAREEALDEEYEKAVKYFSSKPGGIGIVGKDEPNDPMRKRALIMMYKGFQQHDEEMKKETNKLKEKGYEEEYLKAVEYFNNLPEGGALMSQYDPNDANSRKKLVELHKNYVKHKLRKVVPVQKKY